MSFGGDVANGTVQANVVVMLNVAVHEVSRLVAGFGPHYTQDRRGDILGSERRQLMSSRDDFHFCSRHLICEATLRSEKLRHRGRRFEGEIGLIAYQNNDRYAGEWSTLFDLLQCRF